LSKAEYALYNEDAKRKISY